VVADEFVVCDALEEFAVADDGVCVGVLAKGGGEEGLGEALVGVVFAHCDLAEDDVALFFGFGFIKGGAQCHASQDVNGERGMCAGQIDVVDGAIEGGVGVDGAAVCLDLLGDLAGGERAWGACAFEEHVL